MGGADRFWGKESVVAMLMREQRASGAIDPVLVCRDSHGASSGCVQSPPAFAIESAKICTPAPIGATGVAVPVTGSIVAMLPM